MLAMPSAFWLWTFWKEWMWGGVQKQSFWSKRGVLSLKVRAYKDGFKSLRKSWLLTYDSGEKVELCCSKVLSTRKEVESFENTLSLQTSRPTSSLSVTLANSWPTATSLLWGVWTSGLTMDVAIASWNSTMWSLWMAKQKFWFVWPSLRSVQNWKSQRPSWRTHSSAWSCRASHLLDVPTVTSTMSQTTFSTASDPLLFSELSFQKKMIKQTFAPPLKFNLFLVLHLKTTF